MNRERIEHFIQVMDEVHQKDLEQGHQHFNIDTWSYPHTLNDDGTANCGTVACALGWLATTDKARAEGLHLVEGSPRYSRNEHRDYFDDMAGARYLDIHEDIASALFFRGAYGYAERTTAADVATRLRYLLKVGEMGFLDQTRDANGYYSSDLVNELPGGHP